MDITVVLVGLIALAIFAVPFYYIAHSKGKTPEPQEPTHHAAARELNHPKSKKHRA